jgi:uncharacterized membrane protein YhaH (DUF805 family)
MRGGSKVSFGQAVSSCFSQYATFSGRARRREFWFWVVFAFIVYVVAIGLDNAFGITFGGGVGWIYLISALVLLLPSIAVTIRRLHDTGRSGWWWLLALVCGIGAIIVLIFCFIDSTPGPNEYGPNPKGV